MLKEYRSGAPPGQDVTDTLILPSHVAGSGTLDRLVDTARNYARAAASDNTLKAYGKDWAHFRRWCRMKGWYNQCGADPLPPSPAMIGLYLADLASGSGGSPALTVSTIERRLSGLAWPGTTRNAALPSIARTATSPRCWPESNANMPARRCRRK